MNELDYRVAIEALENHVAQTRPIYETAKAIDYLKKAHQEALANHCEDNLNMVKQEQGEPDWKALVLNHNADCESRCDMDRCGYKPYFEYSKRRCPDCPVHEMIDVEYTTPPQRTWVGLTDEEYDEIWRMDLNNKELMNKTIAKLKEKNT